MTALVNMLRDLVHIEPGSSLIGLSPTMSSVTGYVNMGSSGIVEQTKGSAHHTYAGTTGTGRSQWTAAGVLMSQPVVDATPYRLKVYARAGNSHIYVIVGTAPASPTGNDRIDNVVSFPISSYPSEKGEFDEIILVPGRNPQDPLFQRPLAFGVAVAVENAINPLLAYNISVQNLAKTAPQFAASMS